MLRVYILPVVVENGVEKVLGSGVIHDALLLGMPEPDRRKLIMDTLADEHMTLSLLALEMPETTPDDIDLYIECVEILTPDPDTVRAEELLASSPQVITQPEQWELLRIIGRRLGYRF